MPYRLKSGRSLTGELRRIAGKQLKQAVAELRAIGNPHRDDLIHEARRHVKKTRALIRLLQPALGQAFSASNRRLRLASHLLAPIADGEAIVDTVERVGRRYPGRLSSASVARVRAALLERERRIDRKASLDRVLQRAAAVLKTERERIAGATLNARGFHAIAPGLERSLRRLRIAAAQANAEPTAENYHRWRRRVKDVWLQARLLESRCAGGLHREERRLEALDGCLGEHHNVVLLEQVLVGEALLSRRQTARWLYALRRYQTGLRRRASAFAQPFAEQKPHMVVRHVRQLWRNAKQRVPRRRGAWRHAA